jgi:nitrogen regulatory protein P-II 1
VPVRGDNPAPGKREVLMKRIEAIIRPTKVSDVCAALDRSGHPGFTISSAEGRGKEMGWVNQVRAMAFPVNIRSKARVEVVARDEDVDGIVDAIRGAAYTGDAGDGTIFVHDVSNVIRIRTNERGATAL